MFDSYIICGTPRTGSTLLCGLLAATGRAGTPDSFYGRAFRDDWAREWGLPERSTMQKSDYEAAYLDAALRCGRGLTPVFGLRLMRENVEDLSEALGLVFPGLTSDKERFARAFGRTLYIHLSRADKLAQAVSYIKARQTGLWHVAPDGTEVERIGAPGEPRYDAALIRGQIAAFEAYDRNWESWFASQGIVPLRIRYQALAEDSARVLADVCSALGVKAPEPGQIKPRVARLADATNEAWIARYRSEGHS